MTMTNILSPTWIWLLTNNLPILYLSADNSCTNLFERMSSILVNIVFLCTYFEFFETIVWSNVGSSV
jgi:hypothetical protein